MIRFILNDKLVETHEHPGSTLLDFVRYEQQLVGTKIGCREGDCGACTLLIGELKDDKINYKSLTSCITPLGNAQGKHVVTIEGLNGKGLTPYQAAMVDESGTQCGFCTVGFVVSLAGCSLTMDHPSHEEVLSAIDGNICRCTGYKSIERAAKIVSNDLQQKPTGAKMDWLIEKSYIPEYFKDIPSRLKNLSKPNLNAGSQIIAGGTDLFVQRHDDMMEAEVRLISQEPAFQGIVISGNVVKIGASTTTSDIMNSESIQKFIPDWYRHFKLVSSTPIRNIATLAGNLINASPIGDLTCMFLALNSTLTLENTEGISRPIALKDFYLGYKKLDLREGEILTSLSFTMPDGNWSFHFEKVSKRRYLDIASVNSAISITLDSDRIVDIHISAGGVGSTPKYLQKTREYLIGKALSSKNIEEAKTIAQDEISPISDVRGSEEYKRLLLNQLISAHFMNLYPQIFKMKALI